MTAQRSENVFAPDRPAPASRNAAGCAGAAGASMTIDAVRRIAAEYRVSERTARRYMLRGETLGARCVGSDGKSYPRGGRWIHPYTPLRKPLAIARANVRRAARADSFHDADLNVLRDIVQEGNRLLRRWEHVTGAGKSHLTQGGAR